MVTNQTLTEAEEEPLMEALLKTARNIIAPNLCNNKMSVRFNTRNHKRNTINQKSSENGICSSSTLLSQNQKPKSCYYGFQNIKTAQIRDFQQQDENENKRKPRN
jgi:aerobic-type carbon monoxide dehydrogenase small subunit (CoxS/CutS family)